MAWYISVHRSRGKTVNVFIHGIQYPDGYDGYMLGCPPRFVSCLGSGIPEKKTLHLPLLLGRGTTQVICIYLGNL